MLTRLLVTCGVALACSLASAQSESGHGQHQAPRQLQDANTPRTVEVEIAPRTGLPVGAKVPNAELVGKDGKPVKLETLIAEADGPVVLIFYRGGWCPYCNKHLAELGARKDELEATGATVLAISPESWEKLSVSAAKVGWDEIDTSYTLLSDPEQDAAREFNLLFEVDPRTKSKYKGFGIDLAKWNANKEWTLPVPAAYVIDRRGVIRFAHADEDYSKRVDVDELLEAVRHTGG